MATPIISRLPQLQSQLANKYAPTSPQSGFLASLNPTTLEALKAVDAARVNQGQNPYTADETQVAGTAADTGKDVINADQPILRDFVSDIKNLATSIPQLPAALFHEATQLPQFATEAQAGINKANGNPLEMLGNVAKAPGARLIPGSFTASQFGTGGPGLGGLLEHPGYTLLDLLPVAEGAAGLTKTVQAARELSATNAAALGTLPERTRPLTTLLTKSHLTGPQEITAPAFGTTLNEDGLLTRRTKQALAPNPVGQALERVGSALGNTGLGNIAKAVTGRNSQTAAQIWHRTIADMQDWVAHPERAPDQLTRDYATILKSTAESHPDFASIPLVRQAEIGYGLSHSSLSDLSLNPTEASYAAHVKAGTNALGGAALQAKALGSVEFPHGTELFPTHVADAINKGRTYTERAKAGNLLRDDIVHPENADIATTHYMLSHMLADTGLGTGQKEQLTRAYLANLEQLGVDVGPARRFIRSPGNSAQTFADSGRLAAMELPASSPIIRTGNDAILTPTAQAALDNLDTIPLTNKGARGRALSTFSAAHADQVIARAEQLEKYAAPARWDDLIGTEADTRIAAKLRDRFAGPSLDAHLAYAAEHSFEQVPSVSGLANDFTNEAAATYKEVRGTWQDLANQGLDPVFRHRVDPSRAARETQFPRPLDRPYTPGQFKARTWDASNSTMNPMVALQHQAMEQVIQAGTQQFLDTITAHLAVPGADLIRELAPAYRAMAKGDPTATSHVAAAIKAAGYTAFDAESFVKGTTKPTNLGISQQSFLPTEVAANLERLRPTPETIAGKVAGTPMRIFRTSVLALSPRWHVNNILGGMVMMAGQARNPLTIWRYTADAWRMAKEGGVGQLEVPGVAHEATALATPSGTAALEGKSFVASDAAHASDRALARAAKANPATFLHQYGAGQTLRRLWDTAQKGVKASYDFNQLIDDFYRSMAYLEGSHAVPGSLGKEFEAMKGMTREEQVKAGILKSNNVLQQWDKLTPLERSTMRMVLPFYSWTKTVLKYAVTLAVDHPWRVNVMANIARAEQADLASGIPQHLRHLMYIGTPDAHGNVTAINLAGANPFSDVANYASLAGFFAGGQGDLGAITANANPLLSSALQMMGVDTQRGQAELFPDLAFDPVSGQPAVVQGQHPALTVLNNLIPQTRALSSLAGFNSDFKSLASRDPNAAARMIAASLGVPTPLRPVNVPQEIIKDQARQYRGLIDTRNQALRSGDLGLMGQYPGLRAFKVRAEKLRASQAAARFTPSTDVAGGMAPGVSELARRALLPG